MGSHFVTLISLGAPLALLFVIPLWKICRRAGFHPAFSLFALVPLGFFIVAGIKGARLQSKGPGSRIKGARLAIDSLPLGSV